ncbi:MAG: response regulator [Thaumarchaeota archaeon]|nr:response regulator [Nitrososphaerota archaeon]
MIYYITIVIVVNMEDDYKHSDLYTFGSNISYEDFSFLSSQNYCVGFVSTVRDTDITLQTKNNYIKKQHKIFFDMITIILRNFGVKIVKRVDDMILFYFQDTHNTSNKSAFINMLTCSLTISEARKIINMEMTKSKLDPVNYLVGIDYGKLDVARALVSKDELSSFPTSLYSRTKLLTKSNLVIIGQDLYQVLSLLNVIKKEYSFKEIDHYMLNIEETYSIYEITSLKNDLYSSFLTKISPSLLIQKEKLKKERPSNIMIVDDEEDVLLTFRSFLMDKKCGVDTFKNVTEAISCLMTVEPDYYDLILIDIRMIPINGLQFYSRLKTLNCKSKVIFISAIDALDQLTAMIPEIEREFVLQKPVTRDAFIQTVTSALENE